MVQPIEITTLEEYEEVMTRDSVVLCLYTLGCPACTVMEPIYNSVATSLKFPSLSFVRIQLYQHPALDDPIVLLTGDLIARGLTQEQFDFGIPLLLILRKGHVFVLNEGPMLKEEFERWLLDYLEAGQIAGTVMDMSAEAHGASVTRLEEITQKSRLDEVIHQFEYVVVHSYSPRLPHSRATLEVVLRAHCSEAFPNVRFYQVNYERYENIFDTQGAEKAHGIRVYRSGYLIAHNTVAMQWPQLRVWLSSQMHLLNSTAEVPATPVKQLSMLGNIMADSTETLVADGPIGPERTRRYSFSHLEKLPLVLDPLSKPNKLRKLGKLDASFHLRHLRPVACSGLYARRNKEKWPLPGTKKKFFDPEEECVWLATKDQSEIIIAEGNIGDSALSISAAATVGEGADKLSFNVRFFAPKGRWTTALIKFSFFDEDGQPLKIGSLFPDDHNDHPIPVDKVIQSSSGANLAVGGVHPVSASIGFQRATTVTHTFTEMMGTRIRGHGVCKNVATWSFKEATGVAGRKGLADYTLKVTLSEPQVFVKVECHGEATLAGGHGVIDDRIQIGTAENPWTRFVYCSSKEFLQAAPKPKE